MRDQNSIKLQMFRGLWSRGDDDSVPIDHFADCENLSFNKIGVESREGTTVLTTRADIILRMAMYKTLTGVPRIMLLQSNGVNNDLYDLTYSTATPIFSVVNALSDFSMANAYGRAYISFHNRLITSCTGNLYVYDGTGPTGFRVAGGAAPTSPLVETATGAGNIEQGILLLTYSFETISGFITKPIVSTIVSHTFAADANSITVTVPVGPAGTVARRILAAKTIPTGLYNNDYRSQVFYYVPGNGRIADNTTTTVTLSFFNSELIASADYLFDQLATIPGGLLVNNFGTRLLVGGDAANISIVRASSPGEPESFSATSGFLTVDPSEQGGIKNGFEFQGAFVILKTKRTYVTSDNNLEASTWPVTLLDASVGCECHGVSVVSDSASSWKNVALVADRGGLMLFNGTYGEPPLTDKIKSWWQEMDKAVFDQLQVIVDTQIKRIYCLVPKGDDNTLPYCNTILMGDYENGLDPVNIRWCPWAFYPEVWDTKASIHCAMIDLGASTQRTNLKLGMTTDLVVFDRNVHSELSFRYSIPSFARFGFMGFDENMDDAISTFVGLRMRIKGFGRVFITLNSLDDQVIKTYQQYIDISPAPGRLYNKYLNYLAQRATITLHVNTQLTQPFNEFYWQLNKVTVYGKETWANLPSLTNMRT